MHLSQKSLDQKVIAITGATDGIGKAAAIRFSQEGATVILMGKSIKKLEQVYDLIIKQNGPTPALLPINLETATPDHYLEAAELIKQQFSCLDGLLHNAAVVKGLTPIALYSPLQWAQVLQVNLNAPFLLTQSLLPLLKKSPSASILFTVADEGLKGKAYYGAYGVSKAGVLGLTQTLAEELKENTPIRVNSINPKKVQTKLRRLIYPGETPADNPKPETILDRYVYLMSDASQTITGELFNV